MPTAKQLRPCVPSAHAAQAVFYTCENLSHWCGTIPLMPATVIELGLDTGCTGRSELRSPACTDQSQVCSGVVSMRSRIRRRLSKVSGDRSQPSCFVPSQPGGLCTAQLAPFSRGPLLPFFLPRRFPTAARAWQR